MAARYVVRNEWIGRDSVCFGASCDLLEASSSALDWRGGFAFCCVRGRDELRRTRKAGEATRIFRSNGAEEYSVVANKMPVTFNRKSTTRAAVP